VPICILCITLNPHLVGCLQLLHATATHAIQSPAAVTKMNKAKLTEYASILTMNPATKKVHKSANSCYEKHGRRPLSEGMRTTRQAEHTFKPMPQP